MVLVWANSDAVKFATGSGYFRATLTHRLWKLPTDSDSFTSFWKLRTAS